MFVIGDKIVHPMHGAGIIQNIEEQKVLGEIKKYYVLNLSCNNMEIMIPVDSEEQVGLRSIVDASMMEKAIEVLGKESTAMDPNWNRRNREHLARLKTGDILEVAAIVRNLIRVNREKKLSAGEKKVLANARRVLESEMIIVLGISDIEAEELVDRSV